MLVLTALLLSGCEGILGVGDNITNETGFDNSLVSGIYQNANEETSFIELLEDGTGNRYSDEIRSITWEVSDDGTQFTMAYEESEGNTYDFSYTETTITIATSVFIRYEGELPNISNINLISFDDYYNYGEGFGIKYNVTDDYGSLACNIWAISQAVPETQSEEYDYIVTLTKEGQDGGYFSNSTIGAKHRNYGDYDILSFYRGMSVGNQANFYRGVHQLKQSVEIGDNYDIGDDSLYSIEETGSITLNDETFNDCIKVHYTNSSDDTYLKGEGYGIFAKGLGLVYLEFIRDSSDDNLANTKVVYSYLESNTFNPVSINGNVTSDGLENVSDLYVQIATNILNNTSITDQNGNFTLNNIYGTDFQLYFGYDGNDSNQGILDFGYPDDSYFKVFTLNNITSNQISLFVNLSEGIIVDDDTSLELQIHDFLPTNSDDEITLSWVDESDDNTYEISYGIDGDYSNIITGITEKTTTISNLTNGQVYNFSLVAIDTDNNRSELYYTFSTPGTFTFSGSFENDGIENDIFIVAAYNGMSDSLSTITKVDPEGNFSFNIPVLNSDEGYSIHAIIDGEYECSFSSFSYDDIEEGANSYILPVPLKQLSRYSVDIDYVYQNDGSYSFENDNIVTGSTTLIRTPHTVTLDILNRRYSWSFSPSDSVSYKFDYGETSDWSLEDIYLWTNDQVYFYFRNGYLIEKGLVDFDSISSPDIYPEGSFYDPYEGFLVSLESVFTYVREDGLSAKFKVTNIETF